MFGSRFYIDSIPKQGLLLYYFNIKVNNLVCFDNEDLKILNLNVVNRPDLR